MCDRLHSAGVMIAANVKPWLLIAHPDYVKLCYRQGFFMADDMPCRSYLWRAGAGELGLGSYIDFSSLAGRAFWKEGIKSLLDVGIDGIW